MSNMPAEMTVVGGNDPDYIDVRDVMRYLAEQKFGKAVTWPGHGYARQRKENP